MKALLITILLLFLPLTLAAQDYEYKVKVNPKPAAISNNIVFVVDASSTITRSKDIQGKFKSAWLAVTNLLGSDELYFCMYAFHDKDKEVFRKWEEVSPVTFEEQFRRAYAWVGENTGTFSWGQKAIEKALRQECPLNKNKVMKDRLTVIIITDGGFTEAAVGGGERTGDFGGIESAINSVQSWRKNNGLPYASILTVGIENVESWSLGVKQPNAKCQKFLRKIGEQWGGGYIYVRPRRLIRKK